MAPVPNARTVVRRAMYRWQFAAVAVLPLWVLIGWAAWGAPSHSILTVAVLAPVLVVGQLAIAIVLSLRGSVRAERLVSWLDSIALAVFAAAVIGIGFFGPATSWFVALAIAASVATFWLGIWELVVEMRERVRATLAGLGLRIGDDGRPAPARQTPIDRGEYIVLPTAPRT